MKATGPVTNRIPEQAKLATWKRVDRIAKAWEPRFAEQAAKQLELDKRGVLATLHKAQEMAIERKATIDWTMTEQNAIFFLSQAGDRWRKAFVPLIQGVIMQQGMEWNAQFGMQFDVRNLFAEQFFTNYMIKFAQPIMDTTNQDVVAILRRGLEEGWSIPKTQTAIETMFNVYAGDQTLTDGQRLWFANRLPKPRTEMIARTETLRASNGGSQALFTDWGVQYKEWISTPDDRTRGPNSQRSPSQYDHIGANGEVVPIDQPFIRTGEPLMYPGDPSGSAGNTIQCRCTSLPVIPEEGGLQ